jgi:hypothetical protein
MNWTGGDEMFGLGRAVTPRPISFADFPARGVNFRPGAEQAGQIGRNLLPCNVILTVIQRSN